MRKAINPMDWQLDIKGNIEVDSIGDDFILFDNMNFMPKFNYPFRLNVTTVMICLKGSIKGLYNMKPYIINAPCYSIIIADQILQYEYISDDFEGLFIVLSKKFSNDLFSNIQEKLPMLLSVKDDPVIPLDTESLGTMKTYYYMFHRIVMQHENPNRLEIVKHLTMALFYLSGLHMRKLTKSVNQSKQEVLLQHFLDLVEKHYKEERSIGFYSDKLFLTPKYLSTLIRQASGKSAAEWIDDYVILEAKALLKSTNMTIQQISDELNFPSQSFFGKYFKRRVDLSPKEYKYTL